jgi:hypothetical protein
MLIPLKPNCFASTSRLDIYREFRHYNFEQRNQAVANVMSWWELIKDCFNDFNHAKALACLFDVLQCQQALNDSAITDHDFERYSIRMEVVRQRLEYLIDDRYQCGFDFDYLGRYPSGQFIIQLREPCAVPILIGRQFPILWNKKDQNIWRVLVDRFYWQLNAARVEPLVDLIRNFSTEDEIDDKIKRFSRLSKFFYEPPGVFRTCAASQNDHRSQPKVIFFVGQVQVDECWAVPPQQSRL